MRTVCGVRYDDCDWGASLGGTVTNDSTSPAFEILTLSILVAVFLSSGSLRKEQFDDPTRR